MNKEKAIATCNSIMLIGLVIYALCATTSTSGISVGVALAFLGWITRMILTNRFEIKGIALNLPIFVFLGMLVLSALTSSIPILQSLDKVRSLGEKVLLYYLVINGIRDEQYIKWLLVCLIGSLCLLAGYEAGQVIWNPMPEKYSAMIANKTLGGCLGMVIPLVISLTFFTFSSWKIKGGLIVSLAIMIICLNLNSSRGAWLGDICALIFLGLFMNRKILLGLGVVIIISLCLLPKQQMYRVVNMVNPQYTANLERIYLWNSALSMIKEHPFLGHGPGSFQSLYPKYAPDVPEETKKKFYPPYTVGHAHNIFLHLSAEAGIFALLAISWLFMAIFRWGWSVLKHTETQWSRILVLGLLACLIDFAVHGMVDYTLAGKTGYLFWFYLGLVSWIGRQNSKKMLRNGDDLEEHLSPER